jgi:G:T-mismatch repair DNA endonuclease (very short patch repair protein)
MGFSKEDIMKGNCSNCGKLLYKNCSSDLCPSCRKICPLCGGKKDSHSTTCRKCWISDDVTKYIKKKVTWYLSAEEKKNQMMNIRKGKCKFGCGRDATYPIGALVPSLCSKKSNYCPVVAKRRNKKSQESWNRLDEKGRKKRSLNSTLKINEFNKTLPKKEREKIIAKRNKNANWHKNISIARKKVLSRGVALNLNNPSNVSQYFFEFLAKYFPNDEIYYDKLNKECVFPGGFRADFVNRSKRFIVEFNGDFWHCNPKFWESDKYNTAIKMKACEKWAYDGRRYKTFEGCGYRVFVVWESEYKTNKESCISKILKEVTQ